MNKLFLLSTLALSSLYAHECQYRLELDIDMQKGLLSGEATIQSDHPSMRLVDTKANITNIKNATLSIVENFPNIVTKDTNKPVKISFEHKFQPIKGDAMLLETWYPKIDLMCKYETVISHSDLTPIAEATTIKKEKKNTTFKFDKPLDDLNIIASSNYKIDSVTSKDDMELSTYLYPKDRHFSKKYLKKTEEYFALYKDMFGFLPFNNFSVVETPFPAGYSMPTYTLIGKQIIDKGFIIDNSLGHEIAHQWFGNYVYAPYQGNWVEGMTTFYADYLYAKNKKEGTRYRKNMLIKYDSYVSSENEIALIEFQHKSQENKNAIGYEKSAFFFYMLEKKIGKEAFNKGIRLLLKRYPFKIASYKNLREIFEEASGKELLEFFTAWVYKKGALDFSVQNINLKFIENRYVLEFDTISNMNDIMLPISICSNDECLYTNIDLSKQKQKFDLDIEPTRIVIDENYDVFRKMDEKEVPPVISKILSGNSLIVIDKDDEKKFSAIKRFYQNVKYASSVTYEELKNNNVFVIGSDNSLLKRIAIPFKMEGDAKIELYKNPLNAANVIAVFGMKELSTTLLYKLKHLGKYSSVVFNNNTVISKNVKESQQGIRYEINSDTFALKPQTKKLNDVLKDIIKSKVVFIGEKHTEFSSHLNQLKIIKAMYKDYPKLAIGMEMFQTQFQDVLDGFIDGTISEKEMLKKTEYFLDN